MAQLPGNSVSFWCCCHSLAQGVFLNSKSTQPAVAMGHSPCLLDTILLVVRCMVPKKKDDLQGPGTKGVRLQRVSRQCYSSSRVIKYPDTLELIGMDLG